MFWHIVIRKQLGSRERSIENDLLQRVSFSKFEGEIEKIVPSPSPVESEAESSDESRECAGTFVGESDAIAIHFYQSSD